MIHSRWSGGDLIFYDGTQDIITIKDDTDGVIFGEDDEGVDVTFYGDTTGAYLLFDESADLLNFHNINITYATPESQTSTGANISLLVTSNRMQFLTSTGDYHVLLPASSGTGVAGCEFKIFNSTGGTATIYEATTGGSLVATLVPGKGGIVASNAADWWVILGSSD